MKNPEQNLPPTKKQKLWLKLLCEKFSINLDNFKWIKTRLDITKTINIFYLE